jgi:hypothetical protein
MLSGTFAQKLRKLNKDVRIFCGDDSRRAAGLFIVLPDGEYQEICGVDKNQVPEWAIYDEKGRFIKAGWRRTLKVLIGKKLIDRKKAEKLFNADLSYKLNVFVPRDERQEKLNKLKSMGIEIMQQGGF